MSSTRDSIIVRLVLFNLLLASIPPSHISASINNENIVHKSNSFVGDPEFDALVQQEERLTPDELMTKVHQAPKQYRMLWLKRVATEVALGIVPLAVLFGGQQLFNLGDQLAGRAKASLGLFSTYATGRYLYQTIGTIRANLYRNLKYPQIAHQASLVPKSELPQMMIGVPAYDEDPEILRRMITSIFSQSKDIAEETWVNSNGIVQTRPVKNAKPLVVAISVNHKLNPERIEVMKKLLPDSSRVINSEHDYLTRLARKEEPLTLSVELDAYDIDVDELDYVASLLDIANETDEELRSKKILSFELRRPLTDRNGEPLGQRLRRELGLDAISPFTMPRAIILRHFQGKKVPEHQGERKRQSLGGVVALFQQLDKIVKFSDRSVMALMDGDSQLGPNVILKTLQSMIATNAMGLTTSEAVEFIDADSHDWLAREVTNWFSKHIGMKRDLVMERQGFALSCLTGRYSAFSWEIAKQAEFRQLIQTHKFSSNIWGEFNAMTADDKTTLSFVLKQKNHLMLFLPDVKVTSLETVMQGKPIKHAVTNKQRWSGNSQRFAVELMRNGINHNGWYLQAEFINNLISPVTGLLVPSTFLLSAVDWVLGNAPATVMLQIVSWVTFSVAVQLGTVYRLSPDNFDPKKVPSDIFVTILDRWIGSYIKLLTLPALGVQSWVRHGHFSTAANSWVEKLKKHSVKSYLQIMLTGTVLAVSAMGLGMYKPWKVVLDFHQKIVESMEVESTEELFFDETSTAEEIEMSINSSKQEVVIANFDGKIQLDRPIVIDRGNVRIGGLHTSNTIFVAAENDPAFIVNPNQNVSLNNITVERLNEFSTEPLLVIRGGSSILGDVKVRGHSVIFPGTHVSSWGFFSETVEKEANLVLNNLTKSAFE